MLTAAIEKRAHGGTGIVHITKGELEGFSIALPPLDEQRKIAAILSSVDDAIEATKAVIDQVHVVKKALMAELLTRGLPGRHTRFKMTEIGEVPEQWEVVTLGELMKSGPDNGLYKPQSDYGDGTPIVRIDAFDNGDLLVHGGLRRVRATPEEVKRFELKADEILINRVNSLSHLAKATFVTPPPQPTVFESNMMRFAVDESRILPSFAFRLIASDRAKEFFLSRAKQAVAQASVNQQDVRALAVPVPPKTEQGAISQLFETIDERLRAESASLAGLVAGKQSLMSVLLTGEVRVKPDDEDA